MLTLFRSARKRKLLAAAAAAAACAAFPVAFGATVSLARITTVQCAFVFPRVFSKNALLSELRGIDASTAWDEGLINRSVCLQMTMSSFFRSGACSERACNVYCGESSFSWANEDEDASAVVSS